MLIGHLQHHLRDPNRDHQHGRLYRITYEGRPLLEPKKIDGEPVAALLELLKEPENDVRMRAKMELGKRDSKEVIEGVNAWVKLLDEKDPAFEHHLLEALWVHQWHDTVDLDLLGRVLKSPDPRARAQAVRVTGYWRDRVPDALALLKTAAHDEAPRVRLEAVRVASFFRGWEAADVALAILKQPTDYYLDYTLKATMRQLEPWWKSAIAEGKPLAADNPAGIEHVLGSVSSADLAKLPKSPVTLTAMLTRSDVPAAGRQQALTDLAGLKNEAPVATLLATLSSLGDQDGGASRDLSQMLLQQSPADLKPVRGDLRKLATGKGAGVVRQSALAALITADGGVDESWNAAVKSPEALVTFLEALPRVTDPALRGSAFDKVLPLLSTLPEGIQAAAERSGGARYVRIELPRKGTLTLAEVEVLAGGANVAGGGSARQSSTASGGLAERAIDGSTDADYNKGSQTHTRENEDNPWWEVDLKSDQAVERVAVWNRSGFEERLEGFTLTVLDAGRRELFKKSGIPAPRLSTAIEIPHDPAAGIRGAAIRALVSMRAEPARIFTALAALIRKGEQVPAAARAISQLPRDAWSKDLADPTAAALVGWAREVPAEGRTTQDYSEVVQVANELASLLPPDRAAAARKVLEDLKVNVFVIKAVREELRYDLKEIEVEAGKPFEVIFENPDLMPHNIVFVQPGTLRAVAESVQSQAPDKLDKQGRAYVPDGDARVWAASKMLEPGQKETLSLTAPEKPGVYEFVCTFPGHWAVMQGKLVVK